MSRDLLTTNTCEEREQLAEHSTPQSKIPSNQIHQKDAMLIAQAAPARVPLIHTVNTYQFC